MVIVTREPIDPATAYGLIGRERSGSVVLHYAVVKKDAGNDRLTSCIDYQSQGDTAAELKLIEAELRGRFRLEDLLLIRRIGCLEVGGIISLVAASSPNSDDALESCKFGISLLKKMTTIVKTENFS